MVKPHEQFDPDQIKTAVAVLAACIVQTLRAKDPSFERRFLDQLENWDATMKLDKRMGRDFHETILWAREMISGDR